MANTKLKIKKRFHDLHRTQTSEEAKELEASIVEDGRVRDPIVIMQGDVIVDGEHRYKIATKHKLNFDVVVKNFESDDDAEKWILRNQLARRNLSPHDYKLALGKLYNAEKQVRGGDRKAPGSKYQSDTLIGDTAEKVAKETGASTATVKRAGKRAEAYDKLPKSIKTLIDEKPSRASDKAVSKMAEMAAGEWPQLARQVRTGQKTSFDEALGLRNGKAKKPAKGKERVSAAKLVDAMQTRHFSGASGLPQTLEAISKANGGKGPQYEIAKNCLDEFLKAAKKMRGGAK